MTINRTKPNNSGSKKVLELHARLYDYSDNCQISFTINGKTPENGMRGITNAELVNFKRLIIDADQQIDFEAERRYRIQRGIAADQPLDVEAPKKPSKGFFAWLLKLIGG